MQRERDGRCGTCAMDTHRCVVIEGHLVKIGLTVDNILHRGRCLICNPFGDEQSKHISAEGSSREQNETSHAQGVLCYDSADADHEDNEASSASRNIAYRSARGTTRELHQKSSTSRKNGSGASVAKGPNRIEQDGYSPQEKAPQSENEEQHSESNVKQEGRHRSVSSDRDGITIANACVKKRASEGDLPASKKKKQNRAPTEQELFVRKVLARATKKSQNHKVQDKAIENLRVRVEEEKNEDEKRTWIHTIKYCGGLDVVLSAMKTHKTKSAVQYEGCKMIALLAWAEDNETIERKGGANVLLAVLESGPTPKVSAAALEALVNLSTTPSIRNMIIDKNGLNAVIAVVEKSPANVNVQIEGCELILNLASCGDKSNATKIAAAGAIPLVIDAMRNHENDETIIKTCCEALQNLSVTGTARNEITKAGGIPIILDLLEREVEEMQGDILDLLRNLTLGNAVQSEVISNGGVEKVLGFMREFPFNLLLLEKACTVLSILTASKEGCDLFLNERGVDLVLDAMREGMKSESLQEEACLLLCNMKHTSLWREKVKEKKEVREALHKAAKRFPVKCEKMFTDLGAPFHI